MQYFNCPVSPIAILRTAIFLLLFLVLGISISSFASEGPTADENQYSIIVEKDVRIPLSDGSYLMADIFRPDSVIRTSTLR